MTDYPQVDMLCSRYIFVIFGRIFVTFSCILVNFCTYSSTFVHIRRFKSKEQPQKEVAVLVAFLGKVPSTPPYTSHLTYCTLHTTHYTLYTTPCTSHPTPYTLHTTPHTLHPTPYTLHPTPYTLHSQTALNWLSRELTPLVTYTGTPLMTYTGTTLVTYMGTLHSKYEIKEKRSRHDLGFFATPNVDRFVSRSRSASQLLRQSVFHEREIVNGKRIKLKRF